MKRSEATKIILKVWDEYKELSKEQLASKTLRELEKAGLKPKGKYVSSGCLHSMREACDCQGTYTYDWDKE